MRNGLLTLGMTALLLGGCATGVYQQASQTDPEFGRAFRQNVAAQIADPAPAYDYDTPPASSGERTAVAQERYATGQVTKPVAESTDGGGE